MTRSRKPISYALSPLVLCLIAPLSHANQLDADLNNETLHVAYTATESSKSVDLSAGVILTEDNGEAFYASAITNGQLLNHSNIQGGFGGKVYYFATDQGDDFQSLLFGGVLRLTIPEVEGLSAEAGMFYGPGVTTSGDPDNVKDFSLKVRYQAFENASVYVGFRDIQANYDGNDFSFEDGLHLGFSLDL